MRSYRHHFHAGNHADVLKHLVLMLLLEHLGQKEAPFWYIDTHAGAGRYTLPPADSRAEWTNGIGRLWESPRLSADLMRFVERVENADPQGHRRCYPGSPAWARMLCRAQDRLRLFEWHPTDHRALASAADFRADPRIRIFAADGLAGLKGLLPPPSRRAVVLLDPPYEDASEYRGVLNTLTMAVRRFPSGVYALWYPELAIAEVRRLIPGLMQLPAPWLRAHLHLRRPNPDGSGLTGSGMFVLNPPWTLTAQLRPLLAELTERLGEKSEAAAELRQSS